MNIFLLKSLLSVVMVLLTLVSAFTMFEIFGRSEKKYNIEKLKKIHRTSGRIYFLIFIFIAFFCLNFIAGTKTELSPRAAFHGVFALAVIALLFVKIAFIRVYREFYVKAQTIGITVVLITFGMVGSSGGYYLLVTKFGTEKAAVNIIYNAETKQPASPVVFKKDSGTIARGKELYESKCYFCHDAYSTKKIVGPGHKGILKNTLLPVSKKPATAENIANQIKHPYKNMPSFSYLTDEQIQDIVAFLATL